MNNLMHSLNHDDIPQSGIVITLNCAQGGTRTPTLI